MKPPQKNQIYCGSNLEVVKSWPSNCISAIVTDPPYGIGFMGKDWDTYSDKSLKHFHTDHSFAGNKRPKEKSAFTTRATAAGSYDFSPQGQLNFHKWMLVWAQAMLRITKPGGFLLCFGGTRTYHRLACAIEDAGWEIRDCMMWLYGSGFPKSHNISKAIDKAKGAKRKIVGPKIGPDGQLYSSMRQMNIGTMHEGYDRPWKHNKKQKELSNMETAPATDLAQRWDGYGTALKPAWEPIIVAMKPLDGTFAHNAETHGVAGLNIDGGRIGYQSEQDKKHNAEALDRFDSTSGKSGTFMASKKIKPNVSATSQGRWPANLILDEEAGAILGEPARFFYCAKTSRKERNMGMEKVKNNHPTVKPLTLMKYLCTLLKMPGSDQIILDPFLGSGTTGMACKELGINFIGIEKEPEYCEISIKRIAAVSGQEITLHTDNSPTEEPKAIPCHDENRQSIINAACAALRRNQK